MRRFSIILPVVAAGVVAACSSPRDAEEGRRGAPGAPVQISNSRTGAFEAALATREAGFVAAWYDTRSGNAELYMRLLDADGRPAGPERRLTVGPEDSYEPSLEVIDDAVAIAWYDKSADGAMVPKLGVWELNGANRWVQALSAAGRNPVISTYGRDIFSAWIAPGPDGREWVWTAWWTLDGDRDGNPRPIGPAGTTTWNVNAVATDVRQARVVFDAAAGTKAEEIFYASVTPTDIIVRRITADDGVASKYPDVAGAGLFGITWFDERDGNAEVYLFVGTERDLAGEIDARARRVTSTPGESIGAYLEWSDDADPAAHRIGLAWCDDSVGEHEVYFRTFDLNAMPLGDLRRVTFTPESSLVPAIRAWRGGFALAWNEFRPGPEAHAGTSEIAFTIVR